MIDTGIVAHPWHVPQGRRPDFTAHTRAVLARVTDPLAEVRMGVNPLGRRLTVAL
jgi:hypothetical protein